MSEVLDQPNDYYVIEENKIVLKAEKASLVQLILYFTSAAILISTSLILAFLVIIRTSLITTGTIFPVLVCGSAAVYLFRTGLWKTMGEEVFEFSPEEINHYRDVQYFRYMRKSIPNDGWIKISSELAGQDMETLYVQSNNRAQQSTTKVPSSEMSSLLEQADRLTHR